MWCVYICRTPHTKLKNKLIKMCNCRYDKISFEETFI